MFAVGFYVSFALMVATLVGIAGLVMWEARTA